MLENKIIWIPSRVSTQNCSDFWPWTNFAKSHLKCWYSSDRMIRFPYGISTYHFPTVRVCLQCEIDAQPNSTVSCRFRIHKQKNWRYQCDFQVWEWGGVHQSLEEFIATARNLLSPHLTKVFKKMCKLSPANSTGGNIHHQKSARTDSSHLSWVKDNSGENPKREAPLLWVTPRSDTKYTKIQGVIFLPKCISCCELHFWRSHNLEPWKTYWSRGSPMEIRDIQTEPKSPIHRRDLVSIDGEPRHKTRLGHHPTLLFHGWCNSNKQYFFTAEVQIFIVRKVSLSLKGVSLCMKGGSMFVQFRIKLKNKSMNKHSVRKEIGH